MSTIHNEIDLDVDGRHVGYLRLPHSVHRSAYGWIPIPIASVRNAANAVANPAPNAQETSVASSGKNTGKEPVVLLMGGNHGDEYEGQILVSSLIREIDPQWVRGQIIFLPMANFPAAAAGSRTSPLDGGNLNRSFPGDAQGSPTAAIADYIEHTLLARADYLIDLHSGGSSLRYDGANMLAIAPRDPDEDARLKALLGAFGLPRAFLHPANPIHASSAARRQGAISILVELGGGGSVQSHLLREARQGVLNLLAAIGVLSGPLVPEGPPAQTRLYTVSGQRHYVYAYDRGVYEPLIELGERVVAGQAAARIHFPDTPLREPVTVYFADGGEVVCKRVPAAVERGDCLFHLAEPVVSEGYNAS